MADLVTAAEFTALLYELETESMSRWGFWRQNPTAYTYKYYTHTHTHKTDTFTLALSPNNNTIWNVHNAIDPPAAAALLIVQRPYPLLSWQCESTSCEMIFFRSSQGVWVALILWIFPLWLLLLARVKCLVIVYVPIYKHTHTESPTIIKASRSKESSLHFIVDFDSVDLNSTSIHIQQQRLRHSVSCKLTPFSHLLQKPLLFISFSLQSKYTHSLIQTHTLVHTHTLTLYSSSSH